MKRNDQDGLDCPLECDLPEHADTTESLNVEESTEISNSKSNAITSDNHYEPKCLAEHSTSFSLTVTRPGPLLIRLKMHPTFPFSVVHGFDKDLLGYPGEIESDGRIACGDALLSINGLSLENKSTLKSIIEVIHEASNILENEKNVRELIFMKKSCIHAAAALISMYAGAKWKRLQSPRKASDDQVVIQYSEKYDRLLYLISEPTINEEELRFIVAQGIPDDTDFSASSQRQISGLDSAADSGPQTGPHTSLCPGLRPLIWRIVLGYLPVEKSSWATHLESRRTMYRELQAEMTPRAEPELEASNDESAGASAEQRHDDVAYNHNDDDDDERMRDESVMSDAVLAEEIEKDVVRTYPELKFFNDRDGFHQGVLKRILFLYAKLNSGVKYVQGMNEIVGTLYFVFASDSDDVWRTHAEADTFFCFSLLMSDMQDLFIRKMDETGSGIRGRIQEFMLVLEEHDPALVAVMRGQGLDPTFFSLRWMTTLMSREFDIPDTIRLWDSLFADADRHSLMCYLCCAMVIEQRDALLIGDFSDNLRLLQTYPPTAVSVLLKLAYILREADDEKSRVIDPIKLIQQEIQVGREMLGAVMAVAAVRTEQVTETAKHVWMPAMTSAVSRFVQNASENVKKIVAVEFQSHEVVAKSPGKTTDDSVEPSIGDLYPNNFLLPSF